MSKAIIRLLIGFGLFFVLLGFVGKIYFLIGFVLIGVGLYLGAGPDGILRKDQVLDSWATLIEKAQGKAEDILRETEASIRDSKVPFIALERRAIAPGIMKGLMGNTRDFLVVTGKENVKLTPYRMFINARDYGEQLDVSWYLTYTPGLWQAFAALLPLATVLPSLLGDLDLFDQQDLRAYVTTGHRALLDSVEKLMEGMGQDFSKIERKSKGFLGIS